MAQTDHKLQKLKTGVYDKCLMNAGGSGLRFSERMLVASYAAGSNLSLNLKRKCSAHIAHRLQ